MTHVAAALVTFSSQDFENSIVSWSTQKITTQKDFYALLKRVFDIQSEFDVYYMHSSGLYRIRDDAQYRNLNTFIEIVKEARLHIVLKVQPAQAPPSKPPAGSTTSGSSQMSSSVMATSTCFPVNFNRYMPLQNSSQNDE